MQAWIGLGANLQQPLIQLNEAIRQIDLIADVSVITNSSFYRTPPWGELQQDDFINAVVLIDTGLQPLDLLHRLQALEIDMGRVRTGQRRGPRLIDIDILLYGKLQLDTDELTVPHPHMHERAFVLLPLLELDGEIEIPARGRADAFLERLDITAIERLDGANVGG